MKTNEKEKQRMKEYYKNNIEKERKRKREYYRENKKEICKKEKQKRKDNLEEHRKKDREYYEKNRDKILKRKLAYAKKTNYKSSRKFQEKPEIKELNRIRDKTKHTYPLKNKRCERCNSKAEEHHHTTKPYKFDKFWYVCRKCHKKIHKEGKNALLEK